MARQRAMQWASALSERHDLDEALADASASLLERLGAAPDLLLAFVSPHHADAWPRVPEVIARRLDGALLLGCSGRGVIGDGREVENRPGLSLTGARLPGVRLTPVRFGGDVTARNPSAEAMRERIALDPAADSSLLLLPDPLTCDVPALLRELDAAYPRCTKVGGLASGGARPGAHALYLGSDACAEGAVGVALQGASRLDTLVSQGCRPIGEPMIVTSCEHNVIHRLDRGRPARVMRDLYAALEEHDRKLFERSLLLGVEMVGKRSGIYDRGDFLVRDLADLDREAGALAVGTTIERYQVVQFHVRDAETSDQDLRELLHRYRDRLGDSRPDGALLFSCLGRGKMLFGRPDHDTDLVREVLGEMPLGGFFCNGEIGPVGGRTFVHGYTSSLAFFRAP